MSNQIPQSFGSLQEELALALHHPETGKTEIDRDQVIGPVVGQDFECTVSNLTILGMKKQRPECLSSAAISLLPSIR